MPVFHWSWMKVQTVADMLVTNDGIADYNQAFLLKEFIRFLSHESAGVQGFTRMPKEWTELVRRATTSTKIAIGSSETDIVARAWQQEMRDLTLQLSRKLEVEVVERLPRKLQQSAGERVKADIVSLSENNALRSTLEIPDVASPIDIVADLKGRSIRVSMTLKAPDDKVSSKARLNWLLRQIETAPSDDVYISFKWPGRSADTTCVLRQAIADPAVVDRDREHLAVVGFEVFWLKEMGAKFSQQSTFIVELESFVPLFYSKIGQKLTSYVPKAPKIKLMFDVPKSHDDDGNVAD